MKKTLILLAIVSLCLAKAELANAQKLPDTSFNANKLALYNDLMEKSKTGKLAGYSMLAVGAAGIIIGVASANGPVILASCLALAVSNPILCKASKNKGKADMMLMDPNTVEPSKKQELARTYRNQVTRGSIIAWTLFLGGLVGVVYSGVEENGEVLVVSSIAMFGSLPIWMNTAKNKGRLSILLNKDNLKYSYMSGKSTHHSIGLAVPIGR